MAASIEWRSERRRLGALRPQPDNPREIDREHARRLRESWEEYGQVETIAVGPGGEVYNGHQRYLVLLAEHGPDFEVDVRVASRALGRREWQRLTVLLHEGATGAWSFDGLANWEGVDEADLIEWGFDPAALGLIDWPGIPEEPPPKQTDGDRSAELQAKWETALGQVWAAGAHRLACGDCTDPAVLEAVMGDDRAAMVWTDPPYGMRLDTDFSAMVNREGVTGRRYAPVTGDAHDYDPAHLFRDFGYCKELFLFGADYYAERVPGRNAGSWFVWDKAAGGDAPSDPYDKMFGSHFELVWSRARHKRALVRVLWKGVFGLAADDTTRRVHPTQKPAELARWFIEKFSKAGAVVFDGFLGSGTALIACEQTGRVGRGIEIEPAYVAVTLQRLEDYGLAPRRAGTVGEG